VYGERETRGCSIGMLFFAPSFENTLTPTDIPNTLNSFLDGKISPQELPTGPNQRVAQHFGKAIPYGQECQHCRDPSRERSHSFLPYEVFVTGLRSYPTACCSADDPYCRKEAQHVMAKFTQRPHNRESRTET
jgi:hypothetical protein